MCVILLFGFGLGFRRGLLGRLLLSGCWSLARNLIWVVGGLFRNICRCMNLSFLVRLRILWFALFLWFLSLFLFCIRRRIEIRLIVQMPSFFYLCRGFLLDYFGFSLLLCSSMDDRLFMFLVVFSLLQEISFIAG